MQSRQEHSIKCNFGKAFYICVECYIEYNSKKVFCIYAIIARAYGFEVAKQEHVAKNKSILQKINSASRKRSIRN